MGTSFEEIYCLNAVIKKDPNILQLPIYQYYSLCYKQLHFAITAFMYSCLKDITTIVPYSENEYKFIGNGIDTEFNIIPTPEIQNVNIYVGFLDQDEQVYIQQFNYTYDSENSQIVFNSAPSDGEDILIAFYNIGSFDVTLDIDEKTILAEGLNIPYLESYQNNIRSLNQIVYTNSYKVHSQAEQLKQLGGLTINQWRERVDDLIKKYSYRKPKDGLVKLAGRGTNSVR